MVGGSTVVLGASSTSMHLAAHSPQPHYRATSVPICIGDRVIVKGHGPGVVKFVGTLSEDYITDAFYVGVKLDTPDPSRHDGVVRGKRYFSCTPGHGILVKSRNVALVQKPGAGPVSVAAFEGGSGAASVGPLNNKRHGGSTATAGIVGRRPAVLRTTV